MSGGLYAQTTVVQFTIKKEEFLAGDASVPEDAHKSAEGGRGEPQGTERQLQ